MKRGQIAGTFGFLLIFVILAAFLSRMMRGPTVGSLLGERDTEATEEAPGETMDLVQEEEKLDSYRAIIANATRGLFAGHAVDERFLVWVAREYGDDVIAAVAEQVDETVNAQAGAGPGAAAGGQAGADAGSVDSAEGQGGADVGSGAAPGGQIGADTGSIDSAEGQAGADAAAGGQTGADVGPGDSAGGQAGPNAGSDAASTGQSGVDAGSGAAAGGQAGVDAGSDNSYEGQAGVDAGSDNSYEEQTGAYEGQSEVIRINLTDAEEAQIWREQTGKSMQVLWTEYCSRYGLESYGMDGIETIDCAAEDSVLLDFIGDINLDDAWCTMQKLRQEPRGLADCISEELLQELRAADLTVANNEFTFGSAGAALEGKDYTFRADAENVELWSELGVDLVSLANNHSYDYGREGLLETIRILDDAGIWNMGAGRNLDQADDPKYVIANGWKLAFVSATEVERFSNYTKEATDLEAGVFKMTEPGHFLEKVREAKAESDFVIAYVHWGEEGNSQNSSEQHALAERIVEAGADVIIGGHPHRLQGVEFFGEVPVVYSLGNFWFSDSALFTSVAQISIDGNGRVGLNLIPCVQEQTATRIITDEGLLTRFYQYVADLSARIAVDTTGRVYNLGTEQAVGERVLDALTKSQLEWYTAGEAYARHSGSHDLYGNSIDVVGLLN